MDKKMMMAIAMVLLLGGGMLYVQKGKGIDFGGKKMNEVESLKSEEPVVYVVNGEMYLDAGNRKVSMIDLQWKNQGVIADFTINKDVFNSELLNSEKDSSWHLVLGVMKPTAELPEGKILIGKFLSTKKLVFDKGMATFSGTSSEPAQEMSVKFMEK